MCVLAAERIGYCRCRCGRCAVSAIADLVTIDAAGMLGHDRTAFRVVSMRRITNTVLIGDTGQCMRQVDTTGIGWLVVMIDSRISVGITDAGQIAGGFIVELMNVA